MGRDQYEHFSAGDRVRIDVPWSTVASTDGPKWTYDRHEAGTVGVVVTVTNAGFRGLEYTVRTGEGLASGISAANLTLVEAVEIAPWWHQTTYRNGVRIESSK